MAENRNCPECNTMMEYRLGMYECPSCAHTEERTAKPAEEHQPSGPGFRREKWQKPAQAAPAVGSGTSPEAKYDMSLDLDEETSQPRAPLTRLDWEKRIYFWLSVTVGSVSLINDLILVVHAMGIEGIWCKEVLCLRVGPFFFGVFLLAFVLFSGEMWAKGCCALLIIIQILSSFAAVFVVIPYIGRFASGTHFAPTFFSLPWIVGWLIDMAWGLWLLWILYRDYQRSSTV